jgi:LacI family transcriptional regulator
VPDEWVRQVPFSADAGREEMLDLLRHKPTSVFCANDALALGALNAAHASGVRVPQHITVVGWDDIPMSAWDQFSLTTVSSSLDTMASSAVELLLRRIADPSAPATELVVTPRLILRGTHGRVAQAS